MKRSVVVSTIVAFSLVAACKEEHTQPQLRTINGPRDAGGDATVVADADTADTGATIVDSGADTNDGAPVEVYVSDLAYTVVANGYGPAEKDKSNGENGDNDGLPLMLEMVQYAKGLGVHSISQVDVPLNGQYKMFLSDVGVDDEVGANGLVVFRVVVDDVEVYNSGQMAGDTPTKQVAVDVTGKNTMKLFVDDEGDLGSDHADWANARLRK